LHLLVCICNKQRDALDLGADRTMGREEKGALRHAATPSSSAHITASDALPHAKRAILALSECHWVT